MKTVNCVFKV